MAKKKIDTTETATETATDLPGTWVVLTDTFRGIYFGRMVEVPNADKTVTLYDMRHCFSFTGHADAKGTWGLALKGPQSGSRIGPTLKFLVICNVANYTECTPEAVKAWKSAKWE